MSDFPALAQDCVCFANGAGGQIHIGIEDDADKEDVDAAKDTLKEAEKKMGEARRAFAKRNFEKTVELSDKASSIVDQDGPDGIGVQVDE